MTVPAPFFTDRNHAGQWCCCDDFGMKDAYPSQGSADAEVARRNREARKFPDVPLYDIQPAGA